MKINPFLGGSRFRATALLSPALAALLLSRPCMAQTNLTGSGSSVTNAYPYQLPAPTDFQRLQYYYAAYSSSPAPGTEHGIFTLQANNVWSGDWNSSAVPAPTRTQLNAITAQQVDVFRRCVHQRQLANRHVGYQYPAQLLEFDHVLLRADSGDGGPRPGAAAI